MTTNEIKVRRVQTLSGGFFYEARLAEEVVAYRRTAEAAEEAARVERSRREARADLFDRNLAFLSEEAPLPVAEKKIVGLFRARRRAEP